MFSKNITLYNSNTCSCSFKRIAFLLTLDHILNILHLLFTHLHTPISLSVIIFHTCSLTSISHWPTHLKNKKVICICHRTAYQMQNAAAWLLFNLYKLPVHSSLLQLPVAERITFTALLPAHDIANSLADLSAMIHAVWLLSSAPSGCLALHMKRTCLDHLDSNTSAFWLFN